MSTPSDLSAADRTSPLPGARAALVLLSLINIVNYVDRYVLAAVVKPVKETFFGTGAVDFAPAGSLGAVLTWFQHRLGFRPDDALVGLLSMAFMVTYMVTSPVFARMAERHSRWLIVGVGVLLWSAASGASGLATSFFVLLLTRCFVGVGEAAYGPVAPSIISDMYPVAMRGRMLARFYVALPLGSALGYALGGVIRKSHIGIWGASIIGVQQENWRWAFYLVVIPGVVLGLWSLMKRDPRNAIGDRTEGQFTRDGEGTNRILSADRKATWADYMVLFRTPSYVLCTFGMAAMTFAFGGIAFWMPYYLETRPGAPPVDRLLLIFGAITAISGIASTLAGGLVGDRLRSRLKGSYFVVSGAGMLVGFPVFMLTLQTPFPWIWVMTFITLFCLFFNTGPTNTILANVSPARIRAAAFALNIFVIHALGDVISPVIIGLLNDYFHHDMNKSFLVAGLTFLIAGALWMIGARFLERDTRLAPTRL